MRWEYFHGWPIIQHQQRRRTGNVLSSVSLSPIAFPLSPLALNLSLYHLSFSSTALFLSLWPNYFSLCSAPPAPCLSLFLYIVWYNFASSFRIISCIYLFCLSHLSSTPVHIRSPFSANRFCSVPPTLLLLLLVLVCFYPSPHMTAPG